LHLQSAAGNRAVSLALSLQRHAAKGLAAPARVTRTARRWAQLRRARPSATVRQLIDEMVTTLNRELSASRVPPLAFSPKPSRTEGGFRRQEWRISLNLPVIVGRAVDLDAQVSTLSGRDIA